MTTRTRNRLTTALFGTTLLGALACGTAHAAVWTGSGDGTTWQDGNNWDTLAAPALGETVTFGAAANGATINLTADTNIIGDLFVSTTGNSGLTFTRSGGGIELRIGQLGANTTVAAGAGLVIFDAPYDNRHNSPHTITNNSGFEVQFNQGVSAFNNQQITLTGGAFANTSTATLSPNLRIETGTSLDVRGAATSGTGIGSLTGDGTLTNTNAAARTFVVQGTSTFDGTITGNLNLNRGRGNFSDNNVTTLTGNNTYTGVTTVHTGRLVVNGSHIGGGDYFINGKTAGGANNFTGANGILSGTGLIDIGSNTMTFQGFDLSTLGSYDGDADPISLAIAAPGTGIGTLSVKADSVVFGEFSVLAAELAAASLADLFSIDGDLSIVGSNATLSLIDGGGAFDGSSYTVMTWTGTRNGAFADVVGLQGAYEVVYDDDLGQLRIEIPVADDTPAVPEPASIALAMLGGAALFARRRRA